MTAPLEWCRNVVEATTVCASLCVLSIVEGSERFLAWPTPLDLHEGDVEAAEEEDAPVEWPSKVGPKCRGTEVAADEDEADEDDEDDTDDEGVADEADDTEAELKTEAEVPRRGGINAEADTARCLR